MTTQNNSIIARTRNESFIYHGNRLLIVALSVAGLLVENRQISNLLFSISIVLWLWISELEIIENKIFSKASFLMFTVAILVIIAYLSLGVIFSAIDVLLPAKPLAIIFSIIASIAVASLLYRAIHWLMINNPVKNIGKEHKAMHRHFMVDHKYKDGVL
jgi:xanthosine utilization system XapX-like protein